MYPEQTDHASAWFIGIIYFQFQYLFLCDVGQVTQYFCAPVISCEGRDSRFDTMGAGWKLKELTSF